MKKTALVTSIAISFLLVFSMSGVMAFWTPDWNIDFPDFSNMFDCSAMNCADYVSGPCQEYTVAAFPTCCLISNKPAGTSCGALQTCDGNGNCVFIDIPVPTPCDDGNACTTNDMSFLGSCMGTPITCEDNNACTINSCNTVLGCQYTPRNCDDGDSLTIDSCDVSTGCVHFSIPIFPVPCNDQNACTTGDVDLGYGAGCQGTPITCNDQNSLTTDSCDPATGCVYTPNVIAPFCGDVVCNNGETCETCSQDCGDCCGNGIVLGVEECDDNGHNGLVCIPEEGESCTYCSLQCTLVTVQSEEPECTNESTIVSGTIFQETISNGIEGAIVEVTCHHGLLDNTLYAFSESNGGYSVAFTCNQCDYNDLITVNAEKDSLTGTEDGKVTMSYTLPCDVTINVGVVNVPLVPEFGTVIGMLTALGALGVFFLVRRK